ncbi:MAG: hypothetical protein QM658_15885 [Gordonia sp. (in: high G+C Gram-positive bacteria)]
MTILGLLVIAAGSILGAAPASASGDGVVAGINQRTSLTAMPGALWWTPQQQNACSIGWIMNDGTSNYAVTAGHCANRGDSAYIGGQFRPLGEIALSELTDASGGDGPDLAAVRVNPEVPVSDAVPGLKAPSQIMTTSELEHARPDLCIIGQKSGLHCGVFSHVRSNRTEAVFESPTLHRDSGGAVFAVTESGEVVAVGTLVGLEANSKDSAVVQLLDGELPSSMRLGRLSN